MKYWWFLNLLLACFLAKAQNNFEITTEKKTVLPFQLINNSYFHPDQYQRCRSHVYVGYRCFRNHYFQLGK